MNESPETAETLVIGIGNDFRGDDAAGLVAARALRSRSLSGRTSFEVCESNGAAFSLMDLWRGRGRVVVIDALDVGSRPGGDILILDGLQGPLPQDAFVLSTHAFGLKEAIDLSSTLSGLPKELIIVGIVGKQFAMGDPLSAELAHVVQRMVSEWPRCLEAYVPAINHVHGAKSLKENGNHA